MIKEKRIELILKFLKNNDFVKIAYLQEQTNIPIATLQRDIKFLESQHLISRSHGSIIIKEKQENFFANVGLNTSYKNKLAKTAASYVKEDMLIFIDAGSTTLNIIDYIDTKFENVTIVTNSISVISKAHNYKHKINVISGELKKSTNAIIGAQAINAIDKYNFDLCFIGTNGFENDEFTTPSIEEAELKSKVISRSEQILFIFDHSKIGKKFKYKFGSIEDGTIISN